MILPKQDWTLAPLTPQPALFFNEEQHVLFDIIIGVILIPIAIMNIIGPFIIKKVQKLPARIKFKDHDEKEFFQSRDNVFHTFHTQIGNLGFEYLGSSFMEDSHTQTNFSLYTNDHDSTCATVVTMVSNVKEITYVEFSQVYSDGSMLDVCNADQVSPYPRMDLKISARYPEITDAEALYDVFNRLRKSLKNSSIPCSYDKDTGFSMVESFMAKESDMLVDQGYCNEEIDSDGKRSLTFKGACLLTWKSVFPGKLILNRINLTHARKLLKRA